MIERVKYLPFLSKQFFFISKFEKWEKEKIERFQVKAIQGILARAKQIPFYRNLYDKAGVRDASIRSLEDLKKFPMIDKALCREDGLEDYFISRDIPGTMSTATSGSTGMPFQIRIPNRIEMVPPLKVIHAMRQFGWHPLMKGLEIWREDSSTHKKLMRRIGLLKSISIFKPLEEIMEKIQRENPDFLFCSRTFFMVLAESLEAYGVAPRPSFLLCTTENVGDDHRAKLEGFFQCRLINVYGCMEAPTIAYSCPERGNLHVFQTTVIVEVVNPRRFDGREYGEIVLTNLTNDVMPFIRYRTGDMVEINDNKCSCGRKSQAMGRIIGRSDRIIRMREGRIFNFHHFYHLFRSEWRIDQYKVIHHVRDDSLEFVFKLRSFEERQEQAQHLEDIVARGFPGLQCQVRIVERMPIAESGKFNLIDIDEG